MKTLIIPDLHNRWEWVEDFLENTPHDHVIFLGDYFDNFRDGAKTASITAEWLKESLQHPERTHLLGNHDAWYALPEQGMRGTGFKEEKCEAINKVLSLEDWGRIRMAVFHQGWWLSHAGIPRESSAKRTASLLEKEWSKLLASQGSGQKLRFSSRFHCVLWARWRDFLPMRHTNQIVGHSPGSEPRWIKILGDTREKKLRDPKFRMRIFHPVERGDTICIPPEDIPLYTTSENWCLDTFDRHLGILEGGRLEVMENPVELPPEPTPSDEDLAEIARIEEANRRRLMESLMIELMEPRLTPPIKKTKKGS
jgi:hypothetical protein